MVWPVQCRLKGKLFRQFLNIEMGNLEDYLLGLSEVIHVRCLAQAWYTEGISPVNHGSYYSSVTGPKS